MGATMRGATYQRKNGAGSTSFSSRVIWVANLTRDLKVLQLARDLGLSTRGDPLSAIRTYALNQVYSIISNSPLPITTLAVLRRTLASKFRVQIETIESDEDIERIAVEYADFSPHLRRRLRDEFLTGTTEGISLQRENFDPLRARFLVVADGRGEQGARTYFTIWHELSHLLVHPSQLPIPGFRRTPSPPEISKDPIEQVVDHVAGQIAFFEPLFRPAAMASIATHGGLTFAAIDHARAQAEIPTASIYASAIQMVEYTSTPSALVAIAKILKPTEHRRLHSLQQDLGIAPAPLPMPQLRVTALIANRAAQSCGLEIWRNMRVPEDSVLSSAFAAEGPGTWVGDEDQSSWSTSANGPLTALPIRIEATRQGRFVYGLISVLT
jgi:hypothetical protein